MDHLGEVGSIQELQELIEMSRRRLHRLRLRVATQGINARPEDLIEIEDIEKEIEVREAELDRLCRVGGADEPAYVDRLEKPPAPHIDPQIGALEASLHYLPLTFRFSSQADGVYDVELQSDVGYGRGRLALPFGDEELLDFKSGIFQARAARDLAPESSLSRAHEQLKEFGQRLYQAFPPEVKERYQVARDTAADRGYQGVRLRLAFADPQLTPVPWECLYEPGRGEFLSLSGQTRLVRCAELPFPPIVGFRAPLKILVAIPNPDDLPWLDVQQERERIAAALQRLETRRQISIRWLDAVENSQPISFEAFYDALFEFRPHVFHFIGHGVFNSQSAEGLLAFEGPDRRKHLIGSNRVADLVTSGDNSLRLVFLNACHGAETSEIDQLGGVAAALMHKGIPAVIGMQFQISDGAAIEFAAKFYERLAQGAPVDTAVQQARVHLWAVKNNPVEWATPVLHLLRQDGQVFRRKR